MNFETLKEIVELRVRNARNTLTILSRPDFQKLYELSNSKEVVEKLIMADAYEHLRAWYRSQVNLHLGDKSVRELRQIAADLVIPNYTRLTKALLLSEIAKRQPLCVQTSLQ